MFSGKQKVVLGFREKRAMNCWVGFRDCLGFGFRAEGLGRQGIPKRQSETLLRIHDPEQASFHFF